MQPISQDHDIDCACRDLDKLEREKLEKEKEEKRRKERKHRDAFKALLQKHRNEGLLHAKLRWKVLSLS